MRLTPPTKATFGTAFALIVIGILASPQIGLVEDLGDASFYALAAGAILLTFGVVFNRI